MSTLKQRRVAELIIKNKGNVSKSMKEAGYSNASAKNPKVVTQSKGWNELMADHISEEELVKLHEQQLSATKIQVVDKTAQEYPDNDARLKALDLGYKLRGKYAPEQFQMIKRKYQDLSNAELMELQGKLKNFLLKK